MFKRAIVLCTFGLVALSLFQCETYGQIVNSTTIVGEGRASTEPFPFDDFPPLTAAEAVAQAELIAKANAHSKFEDLKAALLVFFGVEIEIKSEFLSKPGGLVPGQSPWAFVHFYEAEYTIEWGPANPLLGVGS